MPYTPTPIDLSRTPIPEELAELIEGLARGAHDTWAAGRLAEGWRYGAERDEAARTHPCLVPYEELPDSEKDYDRRGVRATIAGILALGYDIRRRG